ncbi:MAG: hypothetical protein U1E60_00670 [Reyranellaceae bacterium]
MLVAATISVSPPLPASMPLTVAVELVIVSLPDVPVVAIVSVPTAHEVKVKVERSAVVPEATLKVSCWTPAAAVMVALLEILPAPNCAVPNVALSVPEVLAKVIASVFRKLAALRSTLVPPLTGPIRIVLPPPS